MILRIVVHPANVQDRDGAGLVLDKRTRRRFPFIEVVFADQGYQGPKAATAVAKTGKWTLEVVRCEPGTKGFAVLPKRWIVERTLSWIRWPAAGATAASPETSSISHETPKPSSNSP